MSLGFSALAWYMRADEDAPSYLFEDGLGFGAEAGYIYSSPNRPLVLAFSAAYAYQAAQYLDYDANAVKEGTPPLVLEASAASTFFDRKLLVSLAGISDVYVDGRGGHVLRAMPVAEYRLFPFRVAGLLREPVQHRGALSLRPVAAGRIYDLHRALFAHRGERHRDADGRFEHPQQRFQRE